MWCARAHACVGVCVCGWWLVIGGGVWQADGKVHVNCPAMKARSGISGITIRMPYVARHPLATNTILK